MTQEKCYDMKNMSYEEALSTLHKLKNEGYFDKKRFEVKTPISSRKSIIFNDGKQILSPAEGLWEVVTMTVDNCANDFVWILCDRNDLIYGDIAYRTNNNAEFNSQQNVCVILDDQKYAYVNVDDGISISVNPYKFWYKLTEK